MISWLRATFSGPAGKTALVAAHATAGVLVFLGLSVWHVVGGHRPFDPAGFAGAWIMMIASSAAAIGGHAYVVSKAKSDAGSAQ